MDPNPVEAEGEGEEEEFVLLDLEAVSGLVDIPAGASYVLSGLDSLHPILLIGNIKLIGEYQETVGTCLMFSESEKDASTLVHPETGASEMNLFKDRCIVENTKSSSKEVEPIANLQKILKFRLTAEGEG